MESGDILGDAADRAANTETSTWTTRADCVGRAVGRASLLLLRGSLAICRQRMLRAPLTSLCAFMRTVALAAWRLVVKPAL